MPHLTFAFGANNSSMLAAVERGGPVDVHFPGSKAEHSVFVFSS